VTLSAPLPPGVGQWDIVNNAESYADYVEVTLSLCAANRLYLMPALLTGRFLTAFLRIIALEEPCSSHLMSLRLVTLSITRLAQRSRRKQTVGKSKGLALGFAFPMYTKAGCYWFEGHPYGIGLLLTTPLSVATTPPLLR